MYMENENKIGRPKQTEDVLIFRSRFISLVGSDSTQEEIAAKVGTSRQNVGNWLSGKGRPDILMLTKIAKAYNVSADYLLGLTDIKSVNADLSAACKYTGLSEEAVKKLHSSPAIFPYGDKAVNCLLISLSIGFFSDCFNDLILNSDHILLSLEKINAIDMNDKNNVPDFIKAANEVMEYEDKFDICYLRLERMFRQFLDSFDIRNKANDYSAKRENINKYYREIKNNSSEK